MSRISIHSDNTINGRKVASRRMKEHKVLFVLLMLFVLVSYKFFSPEVHTSRLPPAHRPFILETAQSWWTNFRPPSYSSYGITTNDNSTLPASSVDPLDLPPEPDSVNKSGRYVSMCINNFDKRRVGNQLFNFAAMLHVARLTGRRVAMPRKHPEGEWLDNWFQVSIARVDDIHMELCPCTVIGESGGLGYDQSIPVLSNQSDLVGKSLLVCGWFQSWKYTIGVEAQLRRHLRPLVNISTAVRSFFDSSKPTRWLGRQTYVKVGVHIRAGDTMVANKLGFGYTIPKRPFFERAMTNVTQDTPLDGDKRRIQFFVTSDSIEWVQTALDLTSIGTNLNSSTADVEVTYSVNNSAGFDLTLLTMCDVVVMTTGTFGWWGAWLSNAKKVIYYEDWPRPVSTLADKFVREDFYPSSWISFQGPYFVF